MILLSRFHRVTLLLLALLVASASPQAAYDPVNDDTDIFLTNPAIDADRPNVLILLDNTANWSRNVGGQKIFVNEKSALINVINGLDEAFNVGVMMYPETGEGNDSIDGGYVRYAVRQMTTANKSVLSSAVNAFDIINDKGNNNTIALKMMEAYRYYAGKASHASYGKAKTDFDGNTINPAYTNGLGGYALGSSPTASSLFNSPIVDGCQKNFIIIISNGQANENASALADSESDLATLTGNNPPNTISLTPNGQQGNWADEWAKYMATADVNTNIDGTQNVYTYAVEVDPVTTGQGPDMTALMKSVAANGDGKYFAVSSLNGGQSIVNALNQIFKEIQDVNSVFASTTLPVSVNVRGTNLNQVYIGVFRPDPDKSPRWYGNLKCYKLGYESATGDLFLEDASGNPAENATSGFVNSTSPSFWTTSSSFWSFRTDEENGAGGDSDLPDGDLVEKGGVAQGLRVDYATSQSARKLYTCGDYNTTTSSTDPCGPGDPLSDYLFSTTNTDINATSLLLDSQLVSLLNAENEQSVSALTDTREVTSLTTATGGIAVTELLTALSSSVTVDSITTTESVTLNNLNNSATSQSVTLQYLATSAKKWALGTTSTPHGYSNGQTVTIAGATSALYNGTWIITWVSDTQFKYYVGSNLPAGSDSGSSVTSTTNVTATTASAHPFAPGQQISILSAAPAGFNDTFTITSVPSATTFTFNTPTALAAPTAAGTATGKTLTATATATGHGFATGNTVTISGATPADYNGTFVVTMLDSDHFSYTVPSRLDDTTGPSTASIGTPWARAYAVGHTLTLGDMVTITGADPAGYNGTFEVLHVSGYYFWYNAGVPLPTDVSTSTLASSGTSTTATVVAPGHHFATGDAVTISGATPADYNGNFIVTVADADTFTYNVGTALDAASGTITARLTTPTAFATVVGHGYGAAGATLADVDIRGADQAGYNVDGVTVTVVDADTFRYPLTANVGEAATGSPVAVTDSTLVQARVVSHGFNSGDTVNIAGATPSAFNGTAISITVTSPDTFTYTIGSPQGVASGTITVELSGAGGSSSTEITNIVNWMRGQDNFEDENVDGGNTDARASIHGDVLHARPAVINYNRFGDDNDVYVFYGANDGVFRAVKGGFDSAAGEPEPGTEAWGFVPVEFFSKLRRLRNNEPTISSSNKKPYFADGSIGAYTNDDMSKVYIYLSMRRGGRFIYALNVTDPDAPKLLWQRDSGDSGWSELGYTWSLPKVIDQVRAHTNPVLIFGAGYDPDVEDLPPSSITSSSASSVTAGGTYNRGMGRGIFVVDAFTGDILWQAGPGPEPGGISHHYEVVSGMDYAIPSEVTVISNRDGDAVKNRAYVGDTGGNIWRIDMEESDFEDWEVTQLASIADQSNNTSMRKFLYPPDVVYADGYDAVLIGTGDREHPFDTTVVNRMYMFKDTHTGTSVGSHSVIQESNLYDATTNCIQDPSACTSGVTSEIAQADLDASGGWYITLNSGEKVISNAVTLNQVTFFNTNQPGSTAGTASCASDLGIARQYQVYYSDATAVWDRNADSDTDAGDRSETQPGGGYLPSPVPVIVQIDGETHEAVISGVRVDEPPGSRLESRYRKYWYKQIE